jgi:hypothetical protein
MNLGKLPQKLKLMGEQVGQRKMIFNGMGCFMWRPMQLYDDRGRRWTTAMIPSQTMVWQYHRWN